VAKVKEIFFYCRRRYESLRAGDCNHLKSTNQKNIMKNLRKNPYHIILFIFLLVLVSLPMRSHAAGLVAAWGDNTYGQTNVPAGMGYVKQIAAGSWFSAALKADGRVVVWGDGNHGELNLPPDLQNVKAIAVGNFHTLALKTDGTIVSWGYNSYGQTNVPGDLSQVVAVAGGAYQSLALKSDGTVVSWGNNDHGQTNVPAGLSNVVAIGSGGFHSVALKADGKVVAWGDNTVGQTNVPPGLSNVVAISVGEYHTLALRNDGTLAAWGANGQGESTIPQGLNKVIAIAAAPQRNLALKADGALVGWGSGSYGLNTVPAGVTNISAIAAGGSHNLVLEPGRAVQITQHPQSQTVPYTSNVTFTVTATGSQPLSFLWYKNGQVLFNSERITGNSSNSLSISGLQFTDAGTYTVSVSNIFGNVVSSGAVLTVMSPPFIVQQFSNTTARAGSNVLLQVTAQGTSPLSYQWFFNNNPVSGATSTLLSLVNVQPINSGLYSVLVSNVYGTIQTSDAFLTVTDSPPYILTQPVSRFVAADGNTSFSVTARGSLPLSYQWRFNGNDITNATNSMLVLNQLKLEQSGNYNVVIRNPFGEIISAKALLTVVQAQVWGNISGIPTNVPPGLSNLVAVSAGMNHVLALKPDGTVATWMAPNIQGLPAITNVPASLTNVTAVAAGGSLNMALKSDGKVVAWGSNTYGQTNVPSALSNVVAIAVGGNGHSLALRSNGTVHAWGNNAYHQTNVPPGLSNAVAIAAGMNQSVALRSDGTVMEWGLTNGTQSLSNVVAISAGQNYGIALKADGKVAAWGATNFLGMPNNLSNVVAISSAGIQNIALKNDGSVVTWGGKSGQRDEISTNIYAIAAGGGVDVGFYVGLIGNGSPVITINPFSQTVAKGANVQLHVRAVGRQPVTYQWQRDGLNIPGATAASMLLTNVQGKDVGAYRALVQNYLGSATSGTAQLSIPFSNSLPVALNTTNMTWTSLQSPTNVGPWFAQVVETHDGDVAAQSGLTGHGQQSILESSVNGPGTLKFWWKVSSEEGFDFLRFTLDSSNAPIASISGETEWAQVSINISAGGHKLRWSYAKDVTVSDGHDAGWLDEVSFTPNPPIIITQPESMTVNAGVSTGFETSVEQSAGLAYQWLKNGTNIPNATSNRYYFYPATRHDAGVYNLRVSNAGSSVLSSNAILTVRSPQRLGKPIVLPDGTISFGSADVDGVALLPGDMAGFKIQASTNLIDWVTLTNQVTLTNGALRCNDPDCANIKQRFYRVVEQ
jgi:alpha-tubulin suppressor-like RCC1 family protein